MCNGLCRSCPPSEDGACCGGGCGCPSLGTGSGPELETQRPGAGTGPGPTVVAPATLFQSRRLMVGAGSPPLGVKAPGFGLQLGCFYWPKDVEGDTSCLCFPVSEMGLTMPAFHPQILKKTDDIKCYFLHVRYVFRDEPSLLEHLLRPRHCARRF